VETKKRDYSKRFSTGEVICYDNLLWTIDFIHNQQAGLTAAMVNLVSLDTVKFKLNCVILYGVHSEFIASPRDIATWRIKKLAKN
jgi:hypothetical protein